MTTSQRAIPERFRDQIAAMPEYSYGINRVIVTLDDGTRFSDIFVAWGDEIVKAGTSEDIPFDPRRIAKVERQ